jgi:hypothetical protein
MKMEEMQIQQAAKASCENEEHQFRSSILKYKMVACCGAEEKVA